MCHLREIPGSHGQRMLQQVYVVVVEFAAPAGADHQRLNEVRDLSPVPLTVVHYDDLVLAGEAAVGR
jgi:hypothetical protein